MNATQTHEQAVRGKGSDMATETTARRKTPRNKLVTLLMGALVALALLPATAVASAAVVAATPDEAEAATLISGTQFNKAVKNIYNVSATHTTNLTNVTSISFVTSIPSGYTKAASVAADGTVDLYYSGGKVAVYSPSVITAPENVGYMFSGFTKLTSIDLRGLNLSTAKIANQMFNGCSSLPYDGFTFSSSSNGFNTANMTHMVSMFDGCSAFTQAPTILTNNYYWNTSNVTTFNRMFADCTSLTSLDLTDHLTTSSKLTDVSGMFMGCTNLKTIYWSNVSIPSSATSNTMFNQCSKLVGGYGTKYDSAYITATRAVVDSSSTKGYFTGGTVAVKWFNGYDGGVLKTTNVSRGYTPSYGGTPTRDGYDFKSWSPSVGAVNTYSEFTATWTARTFTVPLNANGGSGGTASVTATYGSAMPSATMPTRPGYDFAGYYDTSSATGGTQYYTAAGASARTWNKTSNTTLYARWTARTDTKYTVRHFQMNTSGAYPSTPAATESKTGTTGATLTLANLKKSYNGFTYREGKVGGTVVTTTTILADGSRVIDLYYSRDQYDYVLGTDTGVSTAGSTASGKKYYGATITLKAALSDGYNWSKWASSNTSLRSDITTANTTFTMPAGNLTMTPVVNPKTNTPYKVEYYLQNVTGTGYALDSSKTQSKTGTTDTTASVTASDITGFTFDSDNANNKLSGKIAGDGSLVLKLYYNRDKYTVTLAKGTGISAVSGAGSYYHGATVKIDATVSEGYKWSRWTQTSGGAQVSTTKAYSFTMPTSAVSYTANATENTVPINYVSSNTTMGTVSPASESVKAATGTAAGSTATPKTGYKFTKWTDASGTTVGTNAKYVPSKSNGAYVAATYTANFEPRTDTKYTVRHFQMNTSGAYPSTPAATESKTGTTGATLTLANLAKSYNGFTYREGKVGGTVVTTTTILADGSRVIDLYYSRDQYTVTLAKGTGVSAVSGAGTYYYGVTVKIDATVSEGYTWSRWTQTSGGVQVIDTKAYSFTMPASNVSYTANATVESYTYNIVYQSSLGAQLGTATAKYNYGTTNTIAPKAFDGYTAPASQSVAWDVAADGGKTITFTYTPKTYNVYLHMDGGSWYDEENDKLVTDEIVTLTYTYSIGLKLPDGGTVEKEDELKFGFTFGGWYADEALTGQKVDTITTTDLGDKHLYAEWLEDAQTFYVTLDPDGGSINSGDVTFYIYGQGATLPTDVTKTGYDFLGWFTASGVKVTEITAEDLHDKAFFAKWQLCSYPVELDTAGGTIISGNVTKYYYGQGAVLPANVAKLGHEFAGWYDAAGQRVLAIGATETGGKSYTARWTPLSWDVNLLAQGGVIAPDADVTRYTFGTGAELPGAADVTRATDAKYSYEFDGWYTTPTHGTHVEVIGADETGEKTYYAHWIETPRVYNVALDPAGGRILSGNVTEYKYGEGAILPTNVKRGDFNFKGWYDEAGNLATIIPMTATGDKSYTAMWSGDAYNLTLNVNGGTVVGGVDKYEHGIGYVLPVAEGTVGAATVARTGYTFLGWYDNPEFEGDPVFEIPASASGDKEYWARWEISVYDVFLDAAGGEIAEGEDVVEYTYGAGVLLPGEADVTREGYTFGGWYLDGDFSGEPVTSITDTDLGNKAFVAKWDVIEYTYDVVYVSSTGKALGTDTVTQPFGTVDFEVVAPEKDGYETPASQFVTWDVAADTADGGKTITFTYPIITYTVTYELDGGVINGDASITSGTYTVEDDEIALPTDVTRIGYTFGGWFDNEEFEGDAVKEIDPADAVNKTFWAKWVANEYVYVIKYVSSTGKELGSFEVIMPFGTVDYEIALPDIPGYITPDPQKVTWDVAADAADGGKTITFIYEIITYDVAYELNKGTMNVDAPTSYTVEDDEIVLPTDVTRDGYTFGGWFESEPFEGEAATVIDPADAEDKQFFAKWDVIEYAYDVVYVSSTGKALGTDTVSKPFDTVDFEVVAPVINGYITPEPQLVTWDVAADTADGGKTITFTYPLYELTMGLSCSWMLGGLVNYGTLERVVTIEDGWIELPTADEIPQYAEGYSFTGWSGLGWENVLGVDSEELFEKLDAGDMGMIVPSSIFSASWERNVYTVTLPEGVGFTVTLPEGYDTSVYHGNYFKFTVTQTEGYTLGDVTLDGEVLEPVEVGATSEGYPVRTYVVEDVTSDIDGIEVVATLNTYEVTWANGDYHIVIPGLGYDPTAVPYGTEFKFTVAVDLSRALLGVKVNDEPVEPDAYGVYTIIVTEDTVISVSIGLKTFSVTLPQETEGFAIGIVPGYSLTVPYGGKFGFIVTLFEGWKLLEVSDGKGPLEPVLIEGNVYTYLSSDITESFEVKVLVEREGEPEPEPAVVTAAPKQQAPVEDGATAYFTVELTGLGAGVSPVAWEWQYSYDGGLTWTKSGRASATSATFDIPANETNKPREFRCVVTLSDGTRVESSSAKIELVTEPDPEPVEVTATPKQAEPVEDGATAYFTVELTGLGAGVEARAWEWQYSYDGGLTWIKSGRASSTSATFDIPANETNKPREFRCVVTLSDGTRVESSSAKIELVTEPDPEPVAASVAVSTGPVELGSPASFKAEVSGLAEGVTVTAWQWFLRDGGGEWAVSGAAGNKTDTLVPNANPSFASMREFRCEATLSDGTVLVSEPIGFDIVEPQPVTATPKQAAPVEDGELAEFEVELTGLGAGVSPVAWEWQYSYDGGASWTKSGRASATSATFDIPANETNKPRSFRCVVTLSDGMRVESSATKIELVAEPEPEFVEVTAAPKQAEPVEDGATAYFTVELTGLGAGVEARAWEWQYSYDGGLTWTKSGRASSTSATFDIPANETNKPRSFRCVVTLSDGTRVESSAAKIELVAEPEPEFVEVTAAPKQAEPVEDGATAYFTVELTGLGAGVEARAWEWQYSYDGGLTWTKSGRASSTSATFDIPANETNKPRSFRCVVTLSDGTRVESSAAKIELVAEPVAPEPGTDEDPDDPTPDPEPAATPVAKALTSEVALGTDATFTVTVEGAAEGVEAEGWQWSFSDDGVSWTASSASGAKTAAMTTKVLGERVGRVFKCEVTLSDGTTVESEAIGFEIAAADATVAVTTEAVAVGASATFKAVVEGLAEGVSADGWYWIYSDDGGKTWAKSGAASANTAELTVNAGADRLERQFRCVVELSDGTQLLSESARFDSLVG